MRQRLSVKSSKVFAFLLLAVVALAVNGCSTAEPDNASARPWNAPKGWENGLPMGLSEGR
jgi:hypothetical protein